MASAPAATPRRRTGRLRSGSAQSTTRKGGIAVLDLPDDEPEDGETVVEYELSMYGHMCARGRAGQSGLFATYFAAEMPAWRRMRALRIAAGPLEAVA